MDNRHGDAAMIDPADKQTKSLPMEQPKRGRGRPSTGAAMTPAQKQKAYRERQKRNVTENVVSAIDENMQLRQQLIDALEQIEQLKGELRSRGKVTKIKRHREDAPMSLENGIADKGVWTVQFKNKGQRTWVSCEPQIDFEGVAWGYEATRKHVLEMQKGANGSQWRAVRDDGLMIDPKALK